MQLELNERPIQTRVFKIRFYFGYKIDIFRDNGLGFGSSIQRNNPNNDKIIFFLNKNLPIFKQNKNVFLQHLRVQVGFPLTTSTTL